MIAESQLEQRTRLGMTLFSLGRLADSVGLDPSPSQMINSLVGGLKDPFLFIVAGEVNAGKSMLLNALFGEEFSETSPLPSTDKIRYFRHGFAHRETQLSPELTEIKLPRPFLQNFHIVDTPGVNSIATGHEIVTEQYLPRADAVLFVLPITNPWGAKCWEFLRRIHTELEKRIIIVLQQIDLRSPPEVATITEHLKVCIQRWLKRDLPIFPISARKAFLGRTAGMGRDELMEASRFQPLEDHLNHLLSENKDRLDRVGNTLRMARVILAQINERIAQKEAKLTSLFELLRELGQSVQNQKSATWEECLVTLRPLDQQVIKAGKVAQAAFDAEVQPWPNVFAPDPFSKAPEMATHWTSEAKQAISLHVREVQSLVISGFNQLWKKTRVPAGQAIQEKLPHDSVTQPDAKSLLADHDEIIASLRVEETWKSTLAPLFLRRKRRVIACATGAAIALSVVFAGLFFHWLIMIAIGVVLLGSMPFLASKFRVEDTQSLRVKFADCLSIDQKRLRQKADVALQKWLQKCFQEFSINFKPLLQQSESTKTHQELWHREASEMKTALDELAKTLTN